jgi:hypothetical protein
MHGKQTARRLLGIIAIIGGSLLAAKVSWNLVRSAGYSLEGYRVDLWYLLFQIWFLAVGTYFISVGLRKYRVRREEEQTKKQRIRSGRVLAGAFLILSTINNRLHPVHSRWELKPDNERQAAAMKATETFLTFFIPALGAGLIVAGVRAGITKPVEGKVDLEVVPTTTQIPSASKPGDK